MFILKSFKSFILEVFILKRWGGHFAEVRILRDLGEKQLNVESLKLKEERFRGKQLKVENLKLNRERLGELNTQTQSSETKEELEIGAGRALRVR